MLKNQKRPKSRGFTIIEVVLVLVIAGLIFLAVFFALPSVQRVQRDNQRKNDLGIMMGEIDNFRVNNLGKIPDDASDFNTIQNQYFKGRKDPLTGNAYTVVLRSHSIHHVDITAPPAGSVRYVSGHICGSDADHFTGQPETLVTGLPGLPLDDAHDDPYYALIIGLEGNPKGYCLDSY